MSKKIIIVVTKDEYKIIKKSLSLYSYKYPSKWNRKDKASQILKDISKLKK